MLFAGAVFACDLAVAVEFVFVNCQPLKPDRASGVGFVGGNSDFCAEPVPETVGEPCRCVGKNACRVNKIHKKLNISGVFGQNAIGVP